MCFSLIVAIDAVPFVVVATIIGRSLVAAHNHDFSTWIDLNSRNRDAGRRRRLKRAGKINVAGRCSGWGHSLPGTSLASKIVGGGSVSQTVLDSGQREAKQPA